MKIVRIIPLLDFGGLEKRVKHTVSGLKDSSTETLEIVVLGKEGKMSKQIRSAGIDPIHLSQSFRWINLRLIYSIYQILRKSKPDIVHTSAAEANLHGLIAAKLAGVPIRIGEEIGFPRHGLKWRFIFKMIYKCATQVIAISNAVKDRIVELGEVDEKKVKVVYNPVDICHQNISFHKSSQISSFRVISINRDSLYTRKEEDLYEKICYGEQPFIFIITCRLESVKNLNTLIKVFAELNVKNSNIKMNLWIVGDGSERNKLTELINTLGLQDDVVLWGFQDNIRLFLEYSDAFVLPSFSEGFSIAMVEAMLCGLPCIVTNQGGPSEIIEEGVTGLLVDPFDSKDLFHKMNEVLKMSKEERNALGKRAQEVGKQYSVEKYIQNLLEVYSTNY